jgi:hypothetical protein
MVMTFKLRHNKEFFLRPNLNAEQDNNNGPSHVRLSLVALTDITQLIVCHPTNPQFLILFILPVLYQFFSGWSYFYFLLISLTG